MFSHEYQGKNIYTKLGDVIELKNDKELDLEKNYSKKLSRRTFTLRSIGSLKEKKIIKEGETKSIKSKIIK